MSGENLVSVRSLHRRYGNLHAVNGVSFELSRGEVLGLLGPNGAGKTTTMQMLCGALAPSAGEILIDGESLLESPRSAKRKIGYLPERPPLYPELSVDEYLHFCARLRRVQAGAISTALQRAKSRCGLDSVGRRLIANLSKGYQQRVGIAQAIIHNPQVVVLDEPTTGLDPNQIREIRALIRELGEDHGVVLSTHVLAEVQALCQRVQIMCDGQIALNERLDVLNRSGRSLRVAFRRPPEADELENIAGVSRVERIDEKRFRLFHHPDGNVAGMLTERSVEGRWGLFELIPDQRALEEIFVSITSGGEVPAPVTPPAGQSE
ncbi:MAG TPA: ATP-binding cassette domain-containing protein [Gammaproteobacteria bacterium]|nr:ATP-binding cassette domain-containing protein [Gammaproteobacteria bacterium]